MATTYSDELGNWIKRRNSTRRDRNLVAFLAVRDDVEQALEAGYAITTIWGNLYERKRINFGYDTFLNYINRHIRRKVVQLAEEAPARPVPQLLNKPTPSIQNARSENSRRPIRKPGALSGFTFNAMPTKEDLI
ncbi:MAG: TraK family protein [Pseudomonadota bacterium]